MEPTKEEIRRHAEVIRHKLSGWGKKKRERFKELQADGYSETAAYTIVEEHQGINPGYKKEPNENQ